MGVEAFSGIVAPAGYFSLPEYQLFLFVEIIFISTSQTIVFVACLEVGFFSVSLVFTKYRAATAPTNTDYELTRQIGFIVVRIDLLRYYAKKLWRTNFEFEKPLFCVVSGRCLQYFLFDHQI